MSAYLIVNTGELDTCSGDLYSYVFSSSECGSGQCNFSNTGNAAIPIGDTYFGVSGPRVCDGTIQDAVARNPNTGTDVTIGQYACAVEGQSTLQVSPPCNAVQENAIQPGSRNCDVLLYDAALSNPVPCTEMIGCAADDVNCVSWQGTSFVCDGSFQSGGGPGGVPYICDCTSAIVNPPVVPGIFGEGSIPRSGGCGLPQQALPPGATRSTITLGASSTSPAASATANSISSSLSSALSELESSSSSVASSSSSSSEASSTSLTNIIVPLPTISDGSSTTVESTSSAPIISLPESSSTTVPSSSIAVASESLASELASATASSVIASASSALESLSASGSGSDVFPIAGTLTTSAQSAQSSSASTDPPTIVPVIPIVSSASDIIPSDAAASLSEASSLLSVASQASESAALAASSGESINDITTTSDPALSSSVTSFSSVASSASQLSSSATNQAGIVVGGQSAALESAASQASQVAESAASVASSLSRLAQTNDAYGPSWTSAQAAASQASEARDDVNAALESANALPGGSLANTDDNGPNQTGAIVGGVVGGVVGLLLLLGILALCLRRRRKRTAATSRSYAESAPSRYSAIHSDDPFNAPYSDHPQMQQSSGAAENAPVNNSGSPQRNNFSDGATPYAALVGGGRRGPRSSVSPGAPGLPPKNPNRWSLSSVEEEGRLGSTRRPAGPRSLSGNYRSVE